MQKNQTIKELRNAVDNVLVDLHYSDSCLAKCRATWNRLEQHADEQEVKQYSAELGKTFLHKVYGINHEYQLPRQHHDRVRAVQMLTDYFLHGAVLVKLTKRQYQYPAQFQYDVLSYLDTRTRDGVSDSRLHQIRIALEFFTEFLNGRELRHIAEITPTDMEKFTEATMIASEGTRFSYYSVVRSFLVFCYETGRHRKDLSACLPFGRYRNDDRIPSVYTDDELKRLLSSIDRENPIGKRNYAIILLIARLGLRSGDVCGLRFENLLWESSTVSIIQEKTKIPIVLPLLEDVGIAIIDYLKHGRPECTDARTVFIGHKAPYCPMTASGIYLVVSSCLNISGIPPIRRKRGPHALRHSLASSLLAKETPLPVISEILGHTSTQNTSVYLKVDIEHLRGCSLEVD